jgi:hypothetical protein
MSGEDRMGLLQFLRSVAPEPLPDDLNTETDERVILDRLAQLDGSDAWVAGLREHLGWVGQAIERLNDGAPLHAYAATQPLIGLLDDMAERAADLGLCGGLVQFVLNQRDDLEPPVSELLTDALRDAAAAAAEAWARVDQARCLLSSIEGKG